MASDPYTGSTKDPFLEARLTELFQNQTPIVFLSADPVNLVSGAVWVRQDLNPVELRLTHQGVVWRVPLVRVGS